MNPRHVKAGAVVLAAVMIVGTIMVSAAAAWTAGSDLSINFRRGTFFGDVDSSRRFCERSRKVRVFKKRKFKPDKLIGTDTTNSDGEWSVRERGANGRFYARVLEKEDDRDYQEEARRCREDISRVISV